MDSQAHTPPSDKKAGEEGRSPSGNTATDLRALLRHYYIERSGEQQKELRPLTLPFLSWLGPLDRRQIRAVLFYGSCLNPGMAAGSSTSDFYLVVGSYASFYGRGWRARINRWLNQVVPPNIFRFKLSKYCVISLDDLTHQVSAMASDVYQMGRFSKYMAFATPCDGKTESALIEIFAAAIEQVVERSLPFIAKLTQPVTTRQAIQQALYLSYRGEPRVEAPDKIDKIFASREEFYTKTFGLLLDRHAVSKEWIEKRADGSYHFQQPPTDLIRQARRFIARSRRRALFRWPKYIWTMRDWPSYMIEKIERAHGLHIELSDRERRYPLVFGWKYLWILWKKKILK